MKDYSNLTREEMANLTSKEMANLTNEQMKKIHTDILCALADKFQREEPPHERLVCENGCNSWADEDIKLFCDDENYAPSDDYHYGNDYFKQEWIDDEF
jgi:hypothetical protein